jgi:D-threo-aldose 1-dehydrogenase
MKLGKTGLAVPPIVFGTSCLGNLYQAYPDETKLAILREIFRHSPSPVVLDSAGKYGAGLALEVIGRDLRALGIAPDGVLISNKLGWIRVPLSGEHPTFEPGIWAGLAHDAVQRISEEGILRCWEQGLDLLGAPYRPQLVSVHDPDEYLARPQSQQERQRAKSDIAAAYRALHDLKKAGETRFVGLGAKDWRVIRELADEAELDWVMLACSLTIYNHPKEVIELVESLHGRGVGIVNSAVFNAGFLTGGDFFDYRRVGADDPRDRQLLEWRARFHALCEKHAVAPAAACVRFALSAPGVACVALNTSKPAHVKRNIDLGTAEIPTAFWIEMKDAGLIRRDYPYLG